NDNDPLLCILDDGLNGGASAAKQEDQKAILQSILGVLSNQRAETLWTDNTGKFYIRLDNGAGSISWTTISGAPSSPPGAGARPETDSGTVVSQSTYRATAAGTGFSIGDVLSHLAVTDNAAGALVSSFWLNVTTGARIDPPPSASITPLAPLPDGAATADNQAAANLLMGELVAAAGAPTDGDPGADTSPGSIVAKLTRLLMSTTGLGGLLTDIKARLPSSLSSGRLAVDGSGVTQPVSGVGAVGAAPATPPLHIAALDSLGKKRALQVSSDGALMVATPVPAAPVTGQVVIVTTGTPVQLPTFPLRNGVVIKASVANAQPDASTKTSATVGPQNVTMQYDGHGNGYPLSPGEAASFACADASNVWVNGTAGDVFSFEGN
ncbi:hypothetical protein INQ30_23325, partial [Escherichia coli]|nr:hypothetical protein [Escherichia coli]